MRLHQCWVVVLAVLASTPTWARDLSHDEANAISGPGTLLFLGAGVGLPLLRDGRSGRDHALRAADALLTGTLLSEGLKVATRERRPNGGSNDSFPSGHATAAFAMAGMEASFHPREAPLWFAGAALIGESRVALGRHRFGDVAAGALLGYATARWELSRPRGLVLSPLIGEGRYGLAIAGRF